VPSAKGSEKTAIKNDQHMLPAEIIEERNMVSQEIGQSEIRRLRMEFDSYHRNFL
jgi:hypothetical protein